MFRLSEPEGILEIDEIQITDIGLHDLRSKISIIPQVSFLCVCVCEVCQCVFACMCVYICTYQCTVSILEYCCICDCAYIYTIVCVPAELRMYVYPLFFMQDPILFSGTVRYNLDPLKHRMDVELWNALEKVRICSIALFNHS